MTNHHKEHVIITGAAGNLGRATMDAFLSKGFRITAIISQRQKDRFTDPDGVSSYPVDLVDADHTEEVIHKIWKEQGAAGMIIMIAGGFAMNNLEKTAMADIKRMVDLNFATAYNIVRPAISLMKAQDAQGHFVFIGARPAYVAEEAKDTVAYSLSKSLLFRLSEMINKDGSDRIVSSVVIPGIIDTPANREAMSGADFSDWVTPEEVAANILHLASPAGQKLRESIIKVYGNS